MAQPDSPQSNTWQAIDGYAVTDACSFDGTTATMSVTVHGDVGYDYSVAGVRTNGQVFSAQQDGSDLNNPNDVALLTDTSASSGAGGEFHFTLHSNYAVTLVTGEFGYMIHAQPNVPQAYCDLWGSLIPADIPVP